MRALHVYCDGGFGNRLNGLVAGLLFAEAAELRPIVVWPCNNWCGARFSDIFENQEFEVLERELLTYRPQKEEFQFFMTEDHLGMGVPNLSPLAVQSRANALDYLNLGSRDVFFHSPLIPHYFDMESVCGALCKLRLQSNILRSAENFRKASGLGENYYGLQIRKTDFGAGGADDDALFDLVQKAGDKKFFVCSDNKEVEARFRRLQNVAVYEKKAYVEKLVPGEWTALAADHSGRVYPCNVNRSAQSVVDAVVDLLVLSYSQVVKTSNSTFLNAALLLKAARVIAPKSQAEPRALSLSRHESKPASRTVYVYNTWHLGDLMLALHLLRALATRHKEAHFYFFIQQRYISQLQEMIADLPQIILQPFESPLWFEHSREAVDCWKNAEGFWERNENRWDWSKFMLEHHRWVSGRLGFDSPFHTPVDLLFDYPALQPSEEIREDADFFIVNSEPQSLQLSAMAARGSVYLSEFIRRLGKNHRVVTTLPAEGAIWSTVDRRMTISQIGRASRWFTHHIMVATGPMWPTLSKFNYETHSKRHRIALLDNGETLTVPGLTQMRSVEELFDFARVSGWF